MRDVDAGYPPEWRERLAANTTQLRKLRELETDLVAQALAAGATWSSIAGALGVSRQSAHSRYRHLDVQVRQEVVR